MKKAAIFATVLFASSILSGQTVLTVFHEAGKRVTYHFNSPDYWPHGARMKLYLDGKPLMDLHADRFVSFQIAPGHHVLAQTPDAADDPGALSFDAADGQRLFVRPQTAFTNSRMASKSEPALIDCTAALRLGHDTQPAKGKDVIAAGALEELRFPDAYAAKSGK